MTLSEVSSLCPAPEGMEWREDPDFAHAFILTFADGAVYLRQPTGLVAGQWQLCAEKGDDCIVIYITVPDLPAACRRALTAVGLAPDAEKARLRESLASLNVAHDVAVKHIGKLASENADFRRRLTWTSEVPTEAGAYAVTWTNKIDSDVYGWTRFDGGTHPWQNDDGGRCTDAEMRQQGARFLPLANLKETP